MAKTTLMKAALKHVPAPNRAVEQRKLGKELEADITVITAIAENKEKSKSIEKVKEIMNFGDDFHMCDVSEITDKYVHLESWNEDVPMSDFDAIAKLIAEDGYDIEGFKLLEIPHPKVFCFGNRKKEQYFDVVKFWDDKWQFSYGKMTENGFQNELAHSIQEAIEKNEFA